MKAGLMGAEKVRKCSFLGDQSRLGMTIRTKNRFLVAARLGLKKL